MTSKNIILEKLNEIDNLTVEEFLELDTSISDLRNTKLANKLSSQ